MAFGSGYGYTLQSNTIGIDGWREIREINRMSTPEPMCQPLSYKRIGARVGPIFGQLHFQSR